jgi:hypothetical protein
MAFAIFAVGGRAELPGSGKLSGADAHWVLETGSVCHTNGVGQGVLVGTPKAGDPPACRQILRLLEKASHMHGCSNCWRRVQLGVLRQDGCESESFSTLFISLAGP